MKKIIISLILVCSTFTSALALGGLPKFEDPAFRTTLSTDYPIIDVLATADGKHLVVASSRLIRIYDFDTEKVTNVKTKGVLNRITLSKNSTYIVFTQSEQFPESPIRVYNIKKKRFESAVFRYHTHDVEIEISDSSKYIAVKGRRSSKVPVAIFELKTGKLIKQWSEKWARFGGFSSNSKFAWLKGEKTALHFNLETGAETPIGRVDVAAFVPGSELLAVFHSGRIRVYDAAKKIYERIHYRELHARDITFSKEFKSAAFHAGSVVVVLNLDDYGIITSESVRVCNPKEYKKYFEFSPNGRYFSHCVKEYKKDPKRVLIDSSDSSIVAQSDFGRKFWFPTNDRLVDEAKRTFTIFEFPSMRPMETHDGLFWIHGSEDGKFLANSGGPRLVIVDLGSSKVHLSLESKKHWISTQFSEDSRVLRASFSSSEKDQINGIALLSLKDGYFRGMRFRDRSKMSYVKYVPDHRHIWMKTDRNHVEVLRFK